MAYHRHFQNGTLLTQLIEKESSNEILQCVIKSSKMHRHILPRLGFQRFHIVLGIQRVLLKILRFEYNIFISIQYIILSFTGIS
jgi:hypothetical protein